MKKLLIILLLTGCATARGTHYVQAPVELPQQPIELVISMIVLTAILIIGLSNKAN